MRVESQSTRDKRNVRNATRVRERQAFLRRIKIVLGCSRCAEHDPDCLDFHHADKSTKIFGVGNTAAYQWKVGPIERLLEEIRKCFILCSNCHRKEEAAYRRSIRKHTMEGFFDDGRDLVVGVRPNRTIEIELK